jgi:hypothetical protein
MKGHYKNCLSHLSNHSIKITSYLHRIKLSSSQLLHSYSTNTSSEHKNIITLSPAGYKGIYTYGTCVYIKENYNTRKYVFSGASAGAWNALMMTCKRDILYFKKEILDYSIQNSRNIMDMEKLIKEQILSHYKTDDFDLSRLYIGVTVFDHFSFKTKIFHDFDHLEDAINCCIASSHIPFITSRNLLQNYKGYLCFDGGFSKTPYIHFDQTKLHITPDVWTDKTVKDKLSIREFTTLFSRDKYDFDQMFQQGYRDAQTNKDFLDDLFYNTNQ